MGLPSMLHHLSGFWAERERPDVLLLHYDDLKSDLEGRMRFLASRLAIEVPESRWPDLVRAATFDAMRGRAEALTPVAAMLAEPDLVDRLHRGPIVATC